MSYLLDKSRKRKKFFYFIFAVIALLILIYFRSGIFNKLSSAAQFIFHPVLVLGNNIGGKFSGISSFFISKNSLYKENADLKSKIEEDKADRANYDSVVQENIDLKEILGRKGEQVAITLAAILSKPNQSPYDTLIIDVGMDKGIKEGDIVFALGHSTTGEAFGTVPIGRVAEVYSSSAKVILFSSPGEKTQVLISGKDTFMEIVGRGGGNFEMILPRDFILTKGDQVVLPGIVPYVVGIVETTISDPRDPSQKALLVAPVNIQELKFVEILAK